MKKNTKRTGILYKKFQKGGVYATRQIGTELGKPVVVETRNTNTDMIDPVNQGISQKADLGRTGFSTDASGQNYHEMRPFEKNTYHVKGQPQFTDSGRAIPNPDGLNVIKVPEELSGRFKAGPVNMGVPSFQFKDPQFVKSFNRINTQNNFLKSFWKSNPGLTRVMINNHTFRR